MWDVAIPMMVVAVALFWSIAWYSRADVTAAAREREAEARIAEAEVRLAELERKDEGR